MAEVEIVSRRRKWTPEEKATLLAEVEAEGGRVSVVARRHGISNSLIYNWRAAWKAAASMRMAERVEFVPVGIIGEASDERPALLAAPEQAVPSGGHRPNQAGTIEIDLPNGARIRVDAQVNEKALRRVLQAMKGAL
jgi:transposase